MPTLSPNHDRPYSRRWLWGAIIALAVSRLWLLASFEPLLNGDVTIFFRYAADGVDLERQPYRELEMEYPPQAWWWISAPRRWASEPIYRSYLLVNDGRLDDFQTDYTRHFRRMMAVCDLLAFLLLIDLVRRRRPELLAWSAWGYLLSTTLLPHVLYDRLDAVLLFWFMAWAWCWTRAAGSRRAALWKTAAYAALGCGISFKLIPLALVPACASGDLRQALASRSWRGWLLQMIVLALTALGPFLYYRVTAGPGVWGLFRYHAERGIEIESLAASLLLLLKPLGLTLSVSHGYGSINLDSSLSPLLAALAGPLLLLALGASALLAWRWGQSIADAGYRLALATLAVSVLVAKVLSVQYLIWSLPMLLLLAVEAAPARDVKRLTACLGVIAALSTLLYPYLFFPDTPWGVGTIRNPWPLAPDLHALPCAVLIVRNGLLLAATSANLYALLVDARNRRKAPHLPGQPPSTASGE